MGEAPDPVLSEPQYLLGDEALFDWVEDNLAEIVGADKTLLEEILIDEGVLDQEQPPKKTRKSRIRVKDWWSTAWGIMLQNPDIRDINTRDGKQFRRRYRLPANFFLDWLVPKCKEVNLFNAKRKANGDLMGQIPIEFKLLIGLRILGRGNCFDDIAEASQAGESTVHAIFQEFVLSFSKEFKDSFIFVPEGDELGAIHDVYRRLGFPGCIGSMDCTHIRWYGCPVELSNACHGKEGFPTLGYQAMVSHDRMCLHLSRGFFGAFNDINICQDDPIVRDDEQSISGQFRDIN
jgi:hypothetical protein